jgi:hypothetical protein
MDDETSQVSESPGPPEVGNSGASEDAKNKRRRSRFNGLISGLISGIISSAVVSFALTPTGHATEVLLYHHFSRPSCNNPQWLLQVPDDDIFANSYYFAIDTVPHYGLLHPPGLTVDGNLGTAWLQWWPTKRGGAYDYITWTFPNRYNVRLICVVNGWTEDNNTYYDTLPIGTATIYSSAGSSHAPPVRETACPATTVALKDYINSYSYRWQGIFFRCETDGVTLRIDSVSPSSIAARRGSLIPAPEPPPDEHISEPLVGLSEVRFYYAPRFLSLVPS